MQLVGTRGREHLSVPAGVEVVFVRRRRGEGGLGDDDPAQHPNLVVLPVRVRVVRAAGVAGGVGKWREVEHRVGTFVANVGSSGAGRVEGRERRGTPHGFLGGSQAESGQVEFVDGVLTAE